MGQLRMNGHDHDEQVDTFASARELFDDYLVRRECGEAVDFEQLCRAHATREPELRRLQAEWSRFAVVLARAHESLEETTPRQEEAAAGSNEILARLKEASRPDYEPCGEIGRGGM